MRRLDEEAERTGSTGQPHRRKRTAQFETNSQNSQWKRKNHFHLNPCVKKNTKKNSHAYVMRDNQQSPVN